MPKYIFFIIIVVILAVAGFAFLRIQSPAPAEPAQAGSEAKVELGKEAPEITFTTLDGQEMNLSDFRGKPVMLWLIATWCPTCQVGAKVLSEEKMPDIEKYDLKIIVLKLWNNLGYPGPSLEEFGREWVGENFEHPNWIWAEASQEVSFLYDPRGLPDIYYLIDRDGIIKVIDTAPSATLNKIFDFAR
jgi:thiol-disulfide isomerase/thioredoxin